MAVKKGRNPSRPHWLDDPSVFPPWQAKILRHLKVYGTYCSDHRPLLLSLRRLRDAGYIRVRWRHPPTGRGWYEAMLTAAGQKIFRRRPIKAQARSVSSESLK